MLTEHARCSWNVPFFCQRVGREKKDTLVIRDGVWPYGICSLIGNGGSTDYTSTKDPSDLVQTPGRLEAVLQRTGSAALHLKLSSAAEKSIAWLRHPQEDGEPSTSPHIDKGTSVKQLHFLAKICGFTPMCGRNFYKYQGLPIPFPSNGREWMLPYNSKVSSFHFFLCSVLKGTILLFCGGHFCSCCFYVRNHKLIFSGPP